MKHFKNPLQKTYEVICSKESLSNSRRYFVTKTHSIQNLVVNTKSLKNPLVFKAIGLSLSENEASV